MYKREILSETGKLVYIQGQGVYSFSGGMDVRGIFRRFN